MWDWLGSLGQCGTFWLDFWVALVRCLVSDVLLLVMCDTVFVILDCGVWVFVSLGLCRFVMLV